MPHPPLMFCPYLELTESIEFAGWRVGPLSTFDDGAWGDQKFRERSEAFLRKFTDAHGKPISNPALLGRVGTTLDLQLPAPEETKALQDALNFGFLAESPRYEGAQSWQLITSDNTELFVWPIDVGAGHVTVSTGGLIRTLNGGLHIDDKDLEIRSPLELHMARPSAADPEILGAVYIVCLRAHQAPSTSSAEDRIRAAIHWLSKAWKNTTSIDFGDRLVFVKTGFEAITGVSNSRESARRLRALFESLPDTDPTDTDTLVWSPAEVPKHPHTFNGKTELLTDLEHWFMALASARNRIIHDGILPSPLTYVQPGSAYEGPLFHTGELVLRVAIKASLHTVGHPNLWRTSTWRAVMAALSAAQAKLPQPSR